jgi:hypothetical protein
MKNYLVHKVKHYTNFAETVFRQYRKTKYGIDTARPDIDFDLASIRKELVDWQAFDDGGALSTPNIQFQTWLPVEYDHNVYLRGGEGYHIGSEQIGPQRVAVNYSIAGANNANIIDVNAGGCITRINLNPAITINNNMSYVYTQETTSTLWIIEHKMGMKPNVFTEDLLGNDIQGVVEYVDNNILKISFNQAVAGKAYLS